MKLSWSRAVLGLSLAGGIGLTLIVILNRNLASTIQQVFDQDHVTIARTSASSPPPQPIPDDPSFPVFSISGFESAGYGVACRFTGEIRDRSSIAELRQAFRSRAARGIADRKAALASFSRDDPGQVMRHVQDEGSLVLLLMYEGRFEEAAAWTERAMADAETAGAPPGLQANLQALLGVIHLRRGETENCIDCLGPSSCIFPLRPDAVHQKTSGSREAIRHFTAYLRMRPDDLGVRWLLNVAYMTLGEYPRKVPAGMLVPLTPFRSKIQVGRFENVASKVGLNVRGPNMAGGSVFDDFTGDGLPDVFTTSFDTDLGASFFVNRGDGSFEDRSESAGLATDPLAVNCIQADYDNDGRLDVVLLRGGWENAARLTLLRNKGDGHFEDVTVAAGLNEPIASHSACWGDFDRDGLVDLFVCGEYATGSSDGLFAGDSTLIPNDQRDRCRLYKNQGDGKFLDVADKAGVSNNRYAKGAVWGDYDNDGLIDLYVSNFGSANRLYHNRGDGTFDDLAPKLGVTDPLNSFAGAFLDYDNDGRLDLFVNDYGSNLYGYVASAFDRSTSKPSHPRLFRNLGEAGFKDVSLAAGFDRVVLTMGMAIGDIDNDGFLDIYLGTGLPGYSALMPNVLAKNVEGKRFEDVSESSGTGHLQKGHGSSFADYDGDGDVDLFVEVGGAVPGDRANNLLFQNPGNDRHWLKVKLVGTKTNRAALGARIRADLKNPDGSTRSVHRQIGGLASYGGSTLVETIGLGDARSVAKLTVTWPTSRTTQTFLDVKGDQWIEITEGIETFKVMPRP